MQTDYTRLLGEVEEAASEYRRRRKEALTVAALLHKGGRKVPLPEDALAFGAGDDIPVRPLDDSELDRLIRNHLVRRGSGFKPSEMYIRLTRAGVIDDGSLALRVVQRLNYLETEKVLRRKKEDNRYVLATTPPASQTEEDPF